MASAPEEDANPFGPAGAANPAPEGPLTAGKLFWINF